MKWFPKKLWLRIICYILISLFVVVGFVSWYFGIHSEKDVIAYIGMHLECNSVWKDLALRRIYAGQTLENVYKVKKPISIKHWKSYTFLYYNEPGAFTGITIVARDKKLIFAGARSCAWKHDFFSTISKEKLMGIYNSHWNYIKESRKHKKGEKHD